MSTENDSRANVDVASMTKVQKLAVLLVVLGPESAAQVLKHLSEAELECVSNEMSKLTMVSQAVQAKILEEFTEVAVVASSSLRGGIDYTQGVLEKAMGQFKASSILSRVAPERPPIETMQQILELEPGELVNLMKSEPPQTIALVLSFFSPEKAGGVLSALPTDLRERVVERLATLSSTPVEVLERVVDVLMQRLGSKHTRAFNKSGGLKSAAKVLSALDKSLSRPLLVSLEERKPELSQAIRQLMFTFEDMARLEPITLQRVMRDVDMADLAIALKTAPDTLKATMLACVSKRAAETVNEEIAFMGVPRLRDVEAARLRVVEVVRRLEAEGEIDLVPNG